MLAHRMGLALLIGVAVAALGGCGIFDFFFGDDEPQTAEEAKIAEDPFAEGMLNRAPAPVGSKTSSRGKPGT